MRVADKCAARAGAADSLRGRVSLCCKRARVGDKRGMRFVGSGWDRGGDFGACFETSAPCMHAGRANSAAGCKVLRALHATVFALGIARATVATSFNQCAPVQPAVVSPHVETLPCYVFLVLFQKIIQLFSFDAPPRAPPAPRPRLRDA